MIINSTLANFSNKSIIYTLVDGNLANEKIIWNLFDKLYKPSLLMPYFPTERQKHFVAHKVVPITGTGF